MRWSLIIGLILSLSVVGCTPKIDASSDEKFEASIEKIAKSLDKSEREEFEEALATLIFSSAMSAAFDPGADEDELQKRMLESIDGKSAREVIAEAEKLRERVQREEAQREAERRERERQQVLQEIAELEKAREKARAARAELEKFVIERSRFRLVAQRYGRPKPEIHLKVINNTEYPISRAYFEGTLATPGRSVPWVQDTFNYSIPGGLEPGESAEWNLAPNMFSDWGQVEDRDDMVFTVTTTRLDGADGEALFVDEFGEREENRLQALRAEVGQ